MEAGYTIIPVNPGQDEILGQTCYPNLQNIPVPVDLVDIFRRPEKVLPIVEDAITINARFIWMQEGVINQEAAAKAEEAGLTVIMDRCTKVDHMNLL
jgi:predicted CoA-binding protein